MRALIHWWRARKALPKSDDLVALVAVAHPPLMWFARYGGVCCTCWEDYWPGELIGAVVQAYERTYAMVRRNPAARLACASCVREQLQEGDVSLRWARDAGLLQ
jgi:hypothetical protein